MHEPRPRRHRHHKFKHVLHIDPQKRQEWNEEVAEDNNQPDPPPRALLANHIPRGLVRNVAIPNDEVLSEMDVGIKHRKSEEERPNEIILMLVQDVAQHTAAVK